MSSPNATSGDPAHPSSRSALTLAALGVVYGDIGTSPLYAFKECLSPERGVATSRPSTAESTEMAGVMTLSP